MGYGLSLKHDDGTSNHWPTGIAIKSLTHSMHGYNGSNLSDVFPLLTFDSPASVDSGTIYHIIFENTEADQNANYSSVNTLFTYPAITPSQPFAANMDWSSLESSTAPYTTWSEAPSNTPIMAYYYADGNVCGMGYF